MESGKQRNEHKEEKNDQYYFREIYFALLEKNETKFNELKKEVFEKYKSDRTIILRMAG